MTRRKWGSVYRYRGKWRALAGDEKRTLVGTYESREKAEAALFNAHKLWLQTELTRGTVGWWIKKWLDRCEIDGTRRRVHDAAMIFLPGVRLVVHVLN